MIRKFVLAAAVVAAMPAVASAQTQCVGSSPAGTASCNLNVAASVTVPRLVRLNTAGDAVALTAPTSTDFNTGPGTFPVGPDAAPAITVRTNVAWALQISSVEATNWTGPVGSAKPISHLTYDVGASAAWTPISNSLVQIANGTPTNGTPVAVRFRTLYDSDVSAASNIAGNYTINVQLTLTSQ